MEKTVLEIAYDNEHETAYEIVQYAGLFMGQRNVSYRIEIRLIEPDAEFRTPAIKSRWYSTHAAAKAEFNYTVQGI